MSLAVSRAHASRRAAIAAAGVTAAVAAHVVGTGRLDVIPVAPALWLMLIGAAAVVGTRTGAFAARRWWATALLVVASQAVVHVGMVQAPWAFGLRIHHEDALISPGMAIAHVLAAVVLVAAVCWFERVLAALANVVRVLVAAAARPPRRAALVFIVRASRAVAVRPVALRLAVAPRGPPVPA